MDHQAKYKHKIGSVGEIKERRRDEDISLRKEKRERILNSKRFRFDEDKDENTEHEFTVEQVTEVMNRLQHGSNDKLADLRTLRKSCAQGSLYIDAVFKIENCIQFIVGLLTGSDVELQHEAAWCLTNITAGTHEHALAVAKLAAPYLITFLSSSNHSLQDQCAWALGNLAGDGPECRSLLHAQGIVAPLVKLLQSPSSAVVQSSAFAMSNIARDSQEITKELVLAGVIDVIPQYLKADNRSILMEVAWIITYLSTSGDHVPAMMGQGILTEVVNILVKLASEDPQDVQTVTPLLRCLGNICSGPDENCLAACENPRLLHTLGKYLESSVRHIVKETLWVFSNIAGEPSIATSIAYGPLLEQIKDKLSAGFDIKQEALYVLNNIACHGSEACHCLLQRGMLQSVVPILKSHDVELLNLSLAFCEMILRLTEQGCDIFEQSDGVARLEGLEYHSNTSIAAKANDLLDNYFGIGNEQEEDIS